MGLSLLATTDTQIIRLNGVLYNQTPGYTFLSNFRTFVTDNGIDAFANTLVSNFSSQTDAELAAVVTGNLGLTGDGLATVNAFLEAQFAANPASRGQVLLDYINTFSTLESDAVYGAAAAAFNNKATASLEYSSVSTNTTVISFDLIDTVDSGDLSYSEDFIVNVEDVISEPRQVLSAGFMNTDLGFDFGSTDDNRLTFRNGSNSTGIINGDNFFSLSVEGSPPIAISVPTGEYNGTLLAAEMTKQANAAFGNEKYIELPADVNSRSITITMQASKGTVPLVYDGSYYNTNVEGGGTTIIIDQYFDTSTTTPTSFTLEQMIRQVKDKVAAAGLPVEVGYNQDTQALTFTSTNPDFDRIKVESGLGNVFGLSASPDFADDGQPFVGNQIIPNGDSILPSWHQRSVILIEYNKDARKFTFSSGTDNATSTITVGVPDVRYATKKYPNPGDLTTPDVSSLDAVVGVTSWTFPTNATLTAATCGELKAIFPGGAAHIYSATFDTDQATTLVHLATAIQHGEDSILTAVVNVDSTGIIFTGLADGTTMARGNFSITAGAITAAETPRDVVDTVAKAKNPPDDGYGGGIAVVTVPQVAAGGTDAVVGVSTMNLSGLDLIKGDRVTISVDGGAKTIKGSFDTDLKTTIANLAADLKLETNTFSDVTVDGYIITVHGGFDGTAMPSLAVSVDTSTLEDVGIFQTSSGNYLSNSMAGDPLLPLNVNHLLGIGENYDNEVQVITVGLIDTVNLAPTDISLTLPNGSLYGSKVDPYGSKVRGSIDENTTGAVIGTLSTTDLDGDFDSHSYTLSGTGSELFEIDSSHQLKLKDTVSLDYETQSSYTVTVTTTDSGSLSYSEGFIVNVEDVAETVNLAPTDIILESSSGSSYGGKNLSSGFSIEENSLGAIVGSLSITDLDANDTHTLTVTGSGSDQFEIVNSQLKLKSGVSADYETKSSYTLTVTATDAGGLSYSEDFIVNVENVVVEYAPTAISLSSNRVEENQFGSVAGVLSVTDLDGVIDSHSFSLSGRDAVLFEIVEGQLKLKEGLSTDFETTPIYELTVTATDSVGLSFAQPISVSVIDIPDLVTHQDDEILGSSGDDILQGGTGSDIVYGGLGNDTIYITNKDGVFSDYINGGLGEDQLVIHYEGITSLADFNIKLDTQTDVFTLTDTAGSQIHFTDIEIITVGGHDYEFKAKEPIMAGTANLFQRPISDGVAVYPSTFEIRDSLYANISDSSFSTAALHNVFYSESAKQYVSIDDGTFANIILIDGAWGSSLTDSALSTWVKGSKGNDFIYGNFGSNTISSGAGDDFIRPLSYGFSFTSSAIWGGGGCRCRLHRQ